MFFSPHDVSNADTKMRQSATVGKAPVQLSCVQFEPYSEEIVSKFQNKAQKEETPPPVKQNP